MIGLLFSLYRRAATVCTEQYVKVGLFFLALILYSASGYMYFELAANPDLAWADAAWWSFVTMTTVGYGDLFPSTLGGRLFVGIPTMLLGVSILGYMLSLVASAMVESKLKETRGMKDMTITDHIVLCRFGSVGRILKLLREIRHDASTADAHVVIVDDSVEELPPELRAEKVHFVRGPPARETTLLQANVREARAVIIQAAACTESDNENLRIALTLREVAPDVYSVVECLDPDSEVFFRRAHCDSVVCLASLTGQMIIQELQDPGVGAIVSELTSNRQGKQFYIVALPSDCRSVGELQAHYAGENALLVGIRRGGESILLPEPDFGVSPDDRAILIATSRPAAAS